MMNMSEYCNQSKRMIIIDDQTTSVKEEIAEAVWFKSGYQV